MIKVSASTTSAILPLLLIATALPAQSNDTTVRPAGVSKVRIVRLSEVKGDVKIDLNSGRGYENATANLPIVEANRLRTGTGVAEVEFEDNSTLRVAPDSVVDFPQLELMPTGVKISSVRVLKGMVYASMVNSPGNDFILLFGQRKLQLPPGSHIRLQMEQNQAKLAVLDGSVALGGDSGVTVAKKRTALIPLDSQDEPQVAGKVSSEAFDSWDHEAADYHKRFAAMSAVSGSPYSYGVSDLSYYGSFANYGGCGSMWRPHFASAAWDPFSNGTWAWYPNAGYSWVSPYPWGWTPYHSGSWAYCDGTGWGWMPGGSWNGLSNSPATLISSRSTIQSPLPRAPGRPPLRGESTLMPVNLKPLNPSSFNSEDSFVFRKDSAGLGIPRGSLGKLNGFSRSTEQHGTASTPIYMANPSSMTSVNQNAAIGGAAWNTGRSGLAPSSASPSSRGMSLPAAQNSTFSPSSTSSTASPAGSGSSHPH